MDFEEMLIGAMAEGMGKQGKGEVEDWGSGGTPEELKKMGDLYLTQYKFKPGDLVQWKPGLKNVKSISYGHPAVVLEFIPGRRSNRTERLYGTAYDDIPEDIRCGIIDADTGKFMTFWYESARLEPYEG